MAVVVGVVVVRQRGEVWAGVACGCSVGWCGARRGWARDLCLSPTTGWAAWRGGAGLAGRAGRRGGAVWWRRSQPDPGRPRGRGGAGSSAPGVAAGRAAGLGGPGRAGAVPGALGLGGSCGGRGPRGLVVPRHPRPAWLSGAAEVWDSGHQGAGGVALAGWPGRPRPDPPRCDTPATGRGEGRGQGLEVGGGLAGGGSPHGARRRPTPPLGQSISP